MDFFSFILSRYIMPQSGGGGGDAPEEIILVEGNYTFSYFEPFNGYVASESVELPVDENTEPFMEVYTITIDGVTEEYSFLTYEEGMAMFTGATSGTFMIYIINDGLLVFLGEDLDDEFIGDHELIVKKSSETPSNYVIRIARNGELAWFILKDVVEGEATLRAVNGNDEEICTTKLNFEPSDFGYHTDFMYSGSWHEKNMESVFSALQAGETVTLKITQIVDGKKVEVTYGGTAPTYQPDGSNYHSSAQYYWGNNNIPCSS